MVPLDADHVHQSVDTHWVWKTGSDDIIIITDINSNQFVVSQRAGRLTFIVLVAHDLAPSVVEADGEARTVGLDVAARPRVPVDAGDTHSSGRIGETADGHFHLE